jgi:hypothetical protein
MKTRKFEYRLSGLPGLLVMVVLGVVLLGLVAVVVMVGAAMAAAGLAISAGAGLYYIVKRKLGNGQTSVNWKVENAAARPVASPHVRVIEAEVVRQS